MAVRKVKTNLEITATIAIINLSHPKLKSPIDIVLILSKKIQVFMIVMESSILLMMTDIVKTVMIIMMTIKIRRLKR